jgi:hypothetical protein
MVFEEHRLPIPSNNEYSVPQLWFMLREVESIIRRRLSSEEWNSL